MDVKSYLSRFCMEDESYSIKKHQDYTFSDENGLVRSKDVYRALTHHNFDIP